MSKYIVITSINDLTEAVRKFAEIEGWHVILVGDKKTPPIEKHPNPNITFLSIEEQRKMGFKLYNFCPFNHYSRKNLGYLYAIKQGAKFIADTDDDNIPYEFWGRDISNEPCSIEIVSEPKLVNVYKFFTDEFIWPRGFPLSLVSDKFTPKMSRMHNQRIGVWQGLADGNPDVDAIYRLVIGKLVKFKERTPIALDRGVYCPFNSQNTIWSREAFPYLYLPSTVNFRFTDILRGYIAQRGMWEINLKLAFTSALVYQDRNEHNLMSDFIDEIPCYTQVDNVIGILDKVVLTGYPEDDLRKIYELLFRAGIIKRVELDGINAWIEDLEDLKEII
jgi:hypothetical protein